MEPLEDSNFNSTSDSFSLYARYMRSFNVVNTLVKENLNRAPCDPGSSIHCESESTQGGNIELSAINKHCETNSCLINVCDRVDKGSSFDLDLCAKIDSPCTPLEVSLLENSSATIERSLNEKSNPTDVQLSSEEYKAEAKYPVFITPTMENSNNAVDSVPMFRDVTPAESVFKLPSRELSFNGTIKHVQKLKPIVDPITALSCSNELVRLVEKNGESSEVLSNCSDNEELVSDRNSNEPRVSDISDNISDGNDKASEGTGDSQYEECRLKRVCITNDDGNTVRWHSEQSFSSLEASFDSGVRSPDMFADDDDDVAEEPEPFWYFLKEYEAHDKRKVKKIEETLQGILPPPSVTILKTDVTEMLKKYYSHLPIFNEETKTNVSEENSITPTKRVSFVEIPVHTGIAEVSNDVETNKCSNIGKVKCSLSSENVSSELDTSVNDKSMPLKMCTEIEAVETSWPDVIKCRHYDVYYNVTKYSEKFELLALKYGERYIGAETDTSVNVYSGGLHSPSSASKRKALRLKMAQAKSPGRRLSHLARRRQAFCSAATINEKAQAATAKMVLIDKKKLINSSERKSPRTRRTPGKKTPTRKTPGKKTPAKTPKTRSGGSSKKKAMRRLLMDTEYVTRSQPSRETLKRALFISPEHRKAIPSTTSSSVPAQAMKSKRALFGSPDRLAETKSMDGTQSDHFLKRKRDALDDPPESSRSKIAKSLSFGGDSIGGSQSLAFSRRASDAFAVNNTAELNETHRKKLLWAVSEALRAHGWRMCSPGFREKAGALARLTRRLLALPAYAQRLAAPARSTSDTMLKIARLYVFAIIQGRTVDECFQEEQIKLANEANSKVSGYISAQAYEQLKTRQTSTLTSQVKENTFNNIVKQEQPKSLSKNILQDKLVNIDSNSNSSSGLSMLDRASLGLFKSNSMPSFEEAAKMRARRQISFDNVDFPKR